MCSKPVSLAEQIAKLRASPAIALPRSVGGNFGAAVAANNLPAHQRLQGGVELAACDGKAEGDAEVGDAVALVGELVADSRLA